MPQISSQLPADSEGRVYANEWEMSRNFTLYNDLNHKEAIAWRQSIAKDPKYQAIWQQAIGTVPEYTN